MVHFDLLPLPAALLSSLKRLQFNTPTPIQAEAIPLALKGKDVLGSAQTGTGKTLAYALPLVAHILNNPRGSALVLTPTRELAVQVIGVIQQLLGPNHSVKTALLIGGESMPKQLQQLKLRPRILVGTPGRINDHLERGSLNLHDTGLLVLDETDRMLDMGFGIQLDRILKYLPKKRQTLMFSATLPPQIVKMSEKYLSMPERIAVGSTTTPVANIDQEIIRTTQADKYNDLVKQLEKRQGSIIIFVKTKHGAEKLAIKLTRNNHSADAIHGDLHQRKREKVIRAFRNKRHRIMVATDIASRGLDIPHIEHVINYDLPQCPEDYIHRLGRTARAGAEGASVSFISPEDSKKWKAIHYMLNPGAPPPPSEKTRNPKKRFNWKDKKKKPFGFQKHREGQGGMRQGARRANAG